MTTTESNGALAVRETPDLSPRFVVSLDDLRMQVRQLEEFKRDIMIPDQDYGAIPGTPKPTLLKPGAEKLAMAFGLTPIFTVSNKIEDWERGFFHYEVTCDLYSKRNGDRVANGIGSANSKETRYRWRDAKPTCLNCGRDLRRSRNRNGEQGESGWYCWAKVGGCGATYPAAQINVQGRIENPEPFELVNTIGKMAQKRALVAAVLIATGGSGIWTQDLEDGPGVTGDHVEYIPIDERDVVDVTPRQTAPRRSETDMVTSEDDGLWTRWVQVQEEARQLEIALNDTQLPIARKDLLTYLNEIAQQVSARKKQPAAV